MEHLGPLVSRESGCRRGLARSSPRRPRRSAIALGLLGLLAAGRTATAASWWVGNGGAAPCTHATLNDAIDAAQGNPGWDTIYLVGEGPFVGPFSVLSGEMKIVGGAESCGSTTIVGRSFVTAPSGKRPLTVAMSGGTLLQLQHLNLTTSFGTVAGNGGCLWFAGSGMISLSDSDLANCYATGSGGGLFVSGGMVELEGGALVFANSANYGGGIAAINGAWLTVRDATIESNHAAFDGGGIYASNPYLVNVGSTGSPVPAVIENNVADRDGGGLWVDSGSLIHQISAGPGQPPTEIRGNQAAGSGGGLYLAHAGLYLERATLETNHADGPGGGVAVGAAGVLRSNPPTDPPHLVTDGYPRFVSNTGAQGSAVYVEATAVLQSGSFTGSTAGNNGPAPLAVVGSASLQVSGVTAWGNQVPELFYVESPANLVVEFTSIAGNTVNGLIRQSGSVSNGVTFWRNAIDQSVPLFRSWEAASSGPFVECVVSRYASLLDVASLPPGSIVQDVTIADPGFVDPFAGDLHVFSSSPTIDRCTYDGPTSTDFDADARGFDDPLHANAIGSVFDAGADEFRAVSEVSSGASAHPLRLVADAGSSTGYALDFEQVAAAEGYNVYEGELGSWYSHGGASGNDCDAIVTDLGTGEMRKELLPSSGNHYYLVSAFAAGREGPTGFASGGVEIPPAESSCAP